MAIGSVLSTVIDVGDLRVAEEFWSSVTGLPVIASAYAGRYSYLGQAEPWKQEVTLQLVDSVKGEDANRVHLDIAVHDGIDHAIEQIVALGGTVKKPPSVAPRPGKGDLYPIVDWAVMQDPFGNEFCLIVRLHRDQIDRVVAAAQAGVADDHELRVAAGVARAK